MMQIEEDGEEREDDEEGDKDELRTSPTMPAIQELTFAHLQMLVLL